MQSKYTLSHPANQTVKRGTRVLALGKPGHVTRRWEYRGGMCGRVFVRLDGERITRRYHWYDIELVSAGA